MHSRYALWTIFALALAGMLGSLYFSNFGDPVNNLWLGELFNPHNALPPCDLCWWARIFLYPIVPISAIALWRSDLRAVWYILPLAGAGTLLTLYHYLIQKTPLPALTNCSSAIPCSSIQVQYFGFITIPLLGFVAFASITALAISILRELKKLP